MLTWCSSGLRNMEKAFKKPFLSSERIYNINAKEFHLKVILYSVLRDVLQMFGSKKVQSLTAHNCSIWMQSDVWLFWLALIWLLNKIVSCLNLNDILYCNGAIFILPSVWYASIVEHHFKEDNLLKNPTMAVPCENFIFIDPWYRTILIQRHSNDDILFHGFYEISHIICDISYSAHGIRFCAILSILPVGMQVTTWFKD